MHKSENATVSYSKVKADTYPYSSWLKTPVIKRYKDSGGWIVDTIKNIIVDKKKKTISILDVGGRTPSVSEFAEKHPNVKYHYINDDPADYSMMWTKNNDIVVSSHFIEHIHIDQFMDIMKKIDAALISGGTLILATPNGYGLNWRKYDHVLVWDMQSLYSVVSSLGYDVEIFRLNRKRKNPLAAFIKWMRTPFSYFLEIDFNCEEIVAVCRKLT